MPPRTETAEAPPTSTYDGAPRAEILAVAAAAFRDNLDAYQKLGYHYVVLRGDRLVSAGLSPETAWAQAARRGVAPDEAFCGSVVDGCAVHPF